MANRGETARRNARRRATRDERQVALALPDPKPSKELPKLALHIPPPSSPVSAVRRHDLAARWAADLGELAADLVAERKLEVDGGRPSETRKECTR